MTRVPHPRHKWLRTRAVGEDKCKHCGVIRGSIMTKREFAGGSATQRVPAYWRDGKRKRREMPTCTGPKLGATS